PASSGQSLHASPAPSPRTSPPTTMSANTAAAATRTAQVSLSGRPSTVTANENEATVAYTNTPTNRVAVARWDVTRAGVSPYLTTSPPSAAWNAHRITPAVAATTSRRTVRYRHHTTSASATTS